MSDLFCREFHDSCISMMKQKIIKALIYTFRVYLLAHAIPAIVLKHKELRKNFLNFLYRLIKNIIRSMCFLTGFIISVRLYSCIFHRMLNFDKFFVVLVSGLSSLPIVFETNSRIAEYTVFTIPRVLEGFFDLFNKLGYINPLNSYSNIIFSSSMGSALVLNTYYNDHIPAKYKNAFDFIYGKITRD